MTSLSFYDLLRNVPLFRILSNTDLLNFAEKLIVEVVPEEQIIIEEGKPGNALYIIQSGSVKVANYLQPSGEEVLLSHLGRGDYFGEMALISDEPRSATVIALEKSELLKLGKQDFEELLIAEPRLYKTLGLILAERLKQSNKKRAEAEVNLRRKSFSEGELTETRPLDLIHFAEEHLFTGKIFLQKENENAEISFKHGQLISVMIDGIDGKERFKEIITWDKGKFEVTPEKKAVVISQAGSSTENIQDNPILVALNSVSLYATGILGIAVAKNLLETSRDKLLEKYPALEEISIMSNCAIAVNEDSVFKVTQKSIEGSALFIRQFMNECKNIALGFDQLDIRKLTSNEEKKLEIIGFYKSFESVSDQVID